MQKRETSLPLYDFSMSKVFAYAFAVWAVLYGSDPLYRYVKNECNEPCSRIGFASVISALMALGSGAIAAVINRKNETKAVPLICVSRWIAHAYNVPNTKKNCELILKNLKQSNNAAMACKIEDQFKELKYIKEKLKMIQKGRMVRLLNNKFPPEISVKICFEALIKLKQARIDAKHIKFTEPELKKLLGLQGRASKITLNEQKGPDDQWKAISASMDIGNEFTYTNELTNAYVRLRFSEYPWQSE